MREKEMEERRKAWIERIHDEARLSKMLPQERYQELLRRKQESEKELQKYYDESRRIREARTEEIRQEYYEREMQKLKLKEKKGLL